MLTAPVAPALVFPIFVNSIVPAPELPIVSVVTGFVAPIAPLTVTDPLPPFITRASF